MPHPKDTDRIAAYRAWYASIGRDPAEAARITGINARTLARMASGRQPPAARLLEELGNASTGALRDQLLAAASVEATNA